MNFLGKWFMKMMDRRMEEGFIQKFSDIHTVKDFIDDNLIGYHLHRNPKRKVKVDTEKSERDLDI